MHSLGKLVASVATVNPIEELLSENDQIYSETKLRVYSTFIRLMVRELVLVIGPCQSPAALWLILLRF
jgi:hypothetical protein